MSSLPLLKIYKLNCKLSRVAGMQTKVYTRFQVGKHNLVEIAQGFAILIFNAATVYITISINGTFRQHTVGVLNSNIESIGYADGFIYIELLSSISLGTVLYTPNGTIL